MQNINNRWLSIWKNKCIIDKTYLYAKDPYEAKYHFLINKRETTELKHFYDLKALTEFSNDMHDVYENIDEYNIDKERKMLIVFDDMIADMINSNRIVY